MTDAILRRRQDNSIELRVNGVFVMDDVETQSERVLARIALSCRPRDVLVGGLGLGFTLRELLESSQVEHVVVAELEREIVEWMSSGTIPGSDLISDPRTSIVIDDVKTVVRDQRKGSLDAIILDVDNGPNNLVHQGNAEIYRGDFLEACAERLKPEGCLAVWSMDTSSDLMRSFERIFHRVDVVPVPVELQGRMETYWIYHGGRPRVVTSKTALSMTRRQHE